MDGWEPALTIGGFVRWSTIQLLLCPDLECGVIDSLLRAVPLRDPETPAACWPRGFDRDAAGDVDSIAGARWGRWWDVLLRPDSYTGPGPDEAEVEALRRRIRELEAASLRRTASPASPASPTSPTSPASPASPGPTGPASPASGSDMMDVVWHERRHGDEVRAQMLLEAETERRTTEKTGDSGGELDN